MPACWRIELFGGLRLSCGERSFAFLQAPKAGPLLAYLAYFPRHPQPRELLLELLWPEIDPDTGRHNLRSLVHAIRRQLEPAETSSEPLLLADRAALRLNPPAFTTDLSEFSAALQQAARTAAAAGRAGLLTAAVELYRGELLAGFEDPWVVVERQRLEEQYLGALQQLVLALEQVGDLDRALEHARRAVTADPLREEAHYELMRLYAAAGQPSACLHQYQELERLLREELGESPSAATRALAEELRDSARTVVVARSTLPGPAAPPLAPPYEPPAPPVTPSPPQVVTPSSPRLPAQFTRFFGREEEIAHVAAMLRVSETRLVTITGPGGSGKTRLAVAVAGRLQAEFDGAVWFVPLAEVVDRQRIGDVIRDAMVLPSSPGGEPLEQVAAVLAQQRALLILDNFEQLVESGAPLVRRLLERVPSLTCLVTSRQRLELEGEQEFVVLPLPTPGPSVLGLRSLVFGEQRPQAEHRTPSTEHLLQYPSIALFVDRAQAARPGFQLTEANSAAIAALCDRLEGLPLAIELAAARIAVLSPQQMLARLQVPAARAPRFELLVSHRRDVSARHRSLRAAMEWSYQLLSPELQRFFARLSVFRGSFTLEAAEAVCGGDGVRYSVFGVRPESAPGASLSPTPNTEYRMPTLEYLQQLRESSLVVAEEVRPGGAIRYRLLETLREFAAEQLTSEERFTLEQRFGRYFLDFVESREGFPVEKLRTIWVPEQDIEYANVRVALEWGLTTDPAAALRVAYALGKYWHVRGYWSEAVDFLSRAARWRSEETSRQRCGALRDAGALACELGDYSRAQELLEEAIAQARQIDDPAFVGAEFIGAALHNLGEVAVGRGEYEQARLYFEESLETRRADPRLAPIHLTGPMAGLGDVARARGDYAAARAHYQESLTIFEAAGDKRHAAHRLRDLGSLALLLGDDEAAQRFHEEALLILREYGDRGMTSLVLKGLGDVALARRELETARACYRESLLTLRLLGHRQGIAAALEGWARLAQAEGELEQAARLWGAAQALREAIGSPVPPNEQPALDTLAAALRQSLGEAAFTAAWQEGRSLSWDQAAALALGEE